MHVLETAQIRALEQRLFGDLGLPPALVMDTAGRAIADAIARRLGDGQGRSAQILCGVGNNGGDGLVVARILGGRGWRVTCWIVGDETRWSPEAGLHRDALPHVPDVDVQPCPALEDPRWRDLQDVVFRAALVVDALTGIGLQGDLREPMRSCVQLDCGRAFVVAADVPSGLCAQTGKILGAAMPCDLVVSMGALKPGLLLGDGPNLWRDAEVADIGIPAPWLDNCGPTGQLLTGEWARAQLPMRDDAGFKNRFGHALIVAGSPGKAGAALLATLACMRTGAGLTTLATDAEVLPRVEGRLPDAMITSQPTEQQAMDALIAGKQAVAIGPGLGLDDKKRHLLQALLAAPQPKVIDADALTLMATHPELRKALTAQAIITPHPGEAARLLQTTTAAITAEPRLHARQLADQLGAVVVLKGARTLIVAPDGRWAISNAPNAALAKAGSGDVLTGAIAALLAQGMAPFAAAALGVQLHALAGKTLLARWGKRAGLASDLARFLGLVVADLERPLVRRARDQ